MRYVWNSAKCFGGSFGNLIQMPTKQSQKMQMIMISIVMHAKYEGCENVTSNLIALFQSFNEEENAFHSLAVMGFGIAKNKVSSIGIEYA